MEVEHETPEKWQDELYDLLRRNRITQFADVPDAGHRILIDRSLADPGVHSVAPTSEEEGVALLAGADLGRARGVLLMQSTGVGNCVNMLSLVKGGRFPLLTVFRDVHVSGAKTDRAQLRRVIDTLGPGDVLMVTRLDRLARSTRDLVNTLAVITERKAGFR